MGLRSVFKSLGFLLIALSMMACTEEGDGLTLRDLQAEAIAEENRFKLTSLLDNSDFNTNNVRLEVDAGYYLFSGILGGESLYIRFPEIAKGTYLGSNDPEISLLFIGQDGRNYLSNNDAITSNVIVTITAVDSVNGVFYADFSGTLYDIVAKNPKNRENQLSISLGRINKVSF